ncbi:MAG TPA: methionine--tRNA ligase subunit beta, partial [Chitinophagales bacterium]|nr:methionine--tRNA ligase subunit beta [Chitinophagales bacterium]
KDSEFTWQDFQDRVNNELGNNLGNFVKRVSDLLHKFYDGVVPEFNRTYDFDEPYFYAIYGKLASIESAIVGTHEIDENTGIENKSSAFNFRAAMFEIMQLSTYGNQFLQSQEPWKLIKTDEERVKEIMYIATQIIGVLAYSLKPFLPKTAVKLEQIFNVKISPDFKKVYETKKILEVIPSGTKINPSEILFPKIEDEQIAFQLEKLNKSKQDKNEILKQVQNDDIVEKSEISNLKSEITYDDFSKMDIRTGKILEAEKVPKADKLLKLLVDIGMEQRTIVSGIAEHFTPEEVIGKEVSVLVNLAPRKLRGIESNGMILMAEDENGKLHFVNAIGVAPGNVIK